MQVAYAQGCYLFFAIKKIERSRKNDGNFDIIEIIKILIINTILDFKPKWVKKINFLFIFCIIIEYKHVLSLWNNAS